MTSVVPPIGAPIGGFFELELPEHAYPHADAILLNSGRACIEYVLRARRPGRVLVPRYTCDVVLEPIVKLGLPYAFYDLNDALELASSVELAPDEMLIANNYFGLKDSYCRTLAQRYGAQLLLDCSQAWFAPPPHGAHSFYTPRKFFGVADGGCLHTQERLGTELTFDTSHQRVSHLIKRLDIGPEAAYSDFQRNDASLTGEEMKAMSRLTRRMLASVDHEAARQRRRANFALLDAALGDRNRFDWSAVESGGPMVYPFWGGRAGLRQELIAQRIFVATYWPNVLEWCAPGTTEHRLATEVIPLPVDQRYDGSHMERILSIVE